MNGKMLEMFSARQVLKDAAECALYLVKRRGKNDDFFKDMTSTV